MQTPNPNTTLQLDPNSHLYTTHYSSYYSQSQPQNLGSQSSLSTDAQNLLASQQIAFSVLNAAGFDPYAIVSSQSLSQGAAGYDPGVPPVAYAHQQTVDGSVAVTSAYYQDPNAIGSTHKEAVLQHGGNLYMRGLTIASNGTAGQLVPANLNSSVWTNPIILPRAWKKGPKKAKIVQSAWCEICKIDCNSNDVLDQHKMGKKHKKNLEKIYKATSAPAPAASAESNKPPIGPQENPEKVKAAGLQGMKKKAVGSVEDLESKRRKVLEGGAAASAVRTCIICNVVCNSDTVFKYHLAGQKHAAMLKKHASRAGLTITT